MNTLRNLGLVNARNDRCIILDPDCLPNPSFIRNARAYSDSQVLFGGAINHQQYSDAQIQPSIKLDDRNAKSSQWVDRTRPEAAGVMIYGGVMVMSRSRVLLAGGFDEEFNGGWGAEEHEFANRCRHSGMRIYYSKELLCTHLYHDKSRPNYRRNVEMWGRKQIENATILDKISPYKPRVGVLIATLMRPEYIEQTVRAVFRNLTPVRLLLVNQGDSSSMQQAMFEPWRNRWAVTVQDNTENVRLSVVRNEAMRWAKNLGLQYLVNLDDDMTVHSDGITNLVQAMDEHPEYHAISGWYKQDNDEMCAGGLIVEGNYYNLPRVKGVHPVDYVASGFTAIRLDPLIEYDTSYEMGWNDYDWCEIVKSKGGKLAVCGDAGAHHKGLLTGSGWKEVSDIANYRAIRYNDARANAMSEKFMLKWGFPPKNPKTLPKDMWELVK